MSVQYGGDFTGYAMSSWASTTLLAYDILITFADEAELVWKSEWGLPKILFFVSRYLSFINSLASTLVTTFATSSSFCNVFNPVSDLFTAINSGVGDGLLLIRVMALYHRKRWLRITLIVLYCLVYLVELIVCIADFIFEVNGSAQGPDIGCLGVTGFGDGSWGPQEAAIATTPILALNGLFFVLTVVRLVPAWRQSQDLRTPLSTLFIRDGSMYFAMICAALAIITAFPFTMADRPEITLIGFVWFIVISPITSCRLFLNLRALNRPKRDRSTIRTTDLDRPAFHNDAVIESDLTDSSLNDEDWNLSYELTER